MKNNFKELFRKKQNRELEKTKEEEVFIHVFICEDCGCKWPDVMGWRDRLCTPCHSEKVRKSLGELEPNEQCEKCGCTFHYVVDLRNHICSSHYSLDVRKIS